MITTITNESVALFNALETQIIALNAVDTVNEWHWSPAYDCMSGASGIYVTIWQSTRLDRSVSKRYITTKLDTIVPILGIEITKFKKTE